jgi:hypothetical protein
LVGISVNRDAKRTLKVDDLQPKRLGGRRRETPDAEWVRMRRLEG